MTRADMLAGEFRQEAQVTRRVLERMPEDKMGWKPHEKSWSMAELATHIANLPMWSQSIINEDEFDINPPGGSDYEPPKAETKDEILEAFDRNVGTAADTFAGQSDEGYAAPWTFKNGGEVVFTQPREIAARSFVLRHWIHHRGQLSLYLRLTGAAIPQIYGPSADETEM